MICVCALAGCSSPSYELAPVSGVVTLDGKPLAGASVAFQPRGNSSEPRPTSVATTDDQGKYSLSVISSSREGAVVGDHLVWLSTSSGGAVDDAGRGGVERVPLKYQSGIKFSVPPGGTNRANFDL